MPSANAEMLDLNAPIHDAFISYSRCDKAFASRLGAALRGYKPPKELGVAQRHLDIFRDEEDFTGVEYHEAVRGHLHASNHLVLICAPNARRSEYVNDEIRQFAAMHGADRIVPVLISGLPNNEARADQEAEKAFPEALCEALRMPLAIDYRGFDANGKAKVDKDAFHHTWCSLLANIYGVSRSELEQREKKREARRRLITRSIVGGIMATLIAATAISATFWRQAVTQRTAAVARQLAAQAELSRNQSPRLIERSVLLAVESLKRAPTLEAEMVLRPQLAMLLRPTRRISLAGRAGDYIFGPGRKLVAAATPERVVIHEVLTGKQVAVLHPLPPMMQFQFSPDGKHFATGSGAIDPRQPRNYTAQVWRLQDGKEIARMPYTEHVHMLVFNADGRFLATIDDRFARLWEVETGRKLREIEHEASILNAALSPDGGRLFTQTNSKVNRLWDVSTGKPIDDVKLAAGQQHIAFSPDWRRIATSSDDSIRIADVDTGNEVSRILEPNTTLPAFTDDGKWLVARGANGSVILWDAQTGKELLRVRGVGGRGKVAISPDREYVATLSTAEVMQIWSGTDREVSRIDGGDLISIAFADDKTIMTGSVAGVVQLWETTQGSEAARLPHGASVDYVAYTPDGKHLLTNSDDRSVRVWDVAGSREVARVRTEYGAKGIALDPVDGRHFVVSDDRATRLFETLSGKEIATLKMTEGGGQSVFSSDGKHLATAGLDNIARIWEMPLAREIAHFPLGDGIASIAFSPDGKLVAATTVNSSTAVVWQAVTGREVARFKEKGGYGNVAFSPDGRYLAAGAPQIGGTVLIWNPIVGTEVHRLKEAGAILAFSPDGRLLATTTKFGASIWNVATGDSVTRLAHQSPITVGAFAPDGSLFLTGSMDGAVRAWDPVTGREVSRVQRESPTLSMAVSPDARYVAVGNYKGPLQTWFLRPFDLIVEACNRLTRNLTRDEWSQFLGSEPYMQTCPNVK